MLNRKFSAKGTAFVLIFLDDDETNEIAAWPSFAPEALSLPLKPRGIRVDTALPGTAPVGIACSADTVVTVQKGGSGGSNDTVSEAIGLIRDLVNR